MIDNYNRIQKYDYGYETVKDSTKSSKTASNSNHEKDIGNDGDPGYETLVHPTPSVDLARTQGENEQSLNFSTSHEIVDPGYETVPMYSEPNSFVIHGTNNNNNNNIKGMSEMTSKKSQHVKSGSHNSPNQSSMNDSQTSPRIHMSVREKHSISCVNTTIQSK